VIGRTEKGRVGGVRFFAVIGCAEKWAGPGRDVRGSVVGC